MNKDVIKVMLLWLLIPLIVLTKVFIIVPIVLLLILPIGIFVILVILWYIPKNLEISKFWYIISTLSLFAIISCILVDYSIRVSLWWISHLGYWILSYILSLVVLYRLWYVPKNIYLSLGLSLISTIAYGGLMYLFYFSIAALMSV
jgi:hypothetical protein